MNLTEERNYLRALILGTLLIGLLILLGAAFRGTPIGLGAQRNASRTRTALALTEQALMGPFPTSTGPTPSPTFTPRDTITPTPTPSITPTPTRFRFFLNTATPRTLVPRPDGTQAPILIPTNTAIPVQPTVIVQPPTSVPPTSVPPTSVPPTRVQPTRLPPTQPQGNPTQCVNPQGHPIPCRKN